MSRHPARKPQSALSSALGLAVLAAISGYALLGPTGLMQWGDLQQRLETKRATLATLETERAALRNRVRLLDPRHADPDLVGELLRRELNVVHPDELVLPMN